MFSSPVSPHATDPRTATPRRLTTLLFAACLGGCATVPAAGSDATQNDPFESLNRDVFAINQVVDRAVIKPVAKAYNAVLPEAIRDRIRAVIDNIHEPLVFGNELLQGRLEAAGITGRRFLVNSTVGVGGLFDRASEFGLARQSGDFGQTLYAWGLADGPYLVLPFFGPSNFRDALGLGVDAYASPLRHVGSDDVRREVTASVGISDGIDLRARNIDTLDAIQASSLDFYAYLRSVSRQNRQATLQQARPGAAADELVDPGAPTPASSGEQPAPLVPAPR